MGKIIDPELARISFQDVSIDLFNVFYKFRNDFSDRPLEIELVVIHMPQAAQRDARVMEEWSRIFLHSDVLRVERLEGCTHFYLKQEPQASGTLSMCRSNMRGITLEIQNYGHVDRYVDAMLRHFHILFTDSRARKNCKERLHVAYCT